MILRQTAGGGREVGWCKRGRREGEAVGEGETKGRKEEANTRETSGEGAGRGGTRREIEGGRNNNTYAMKT